MQSQLIRAKPALETVSLSAKTSQVAQRGLPVRDLDYKIHTQSSHGSGIASFLQSGVLASRQRRGRGWEVRKARGAGVGSGCECPLQQQARVEGKGRGGVEEEGQWGDWAAGDPLGAPRRRDARSHLSSSAVLWNGLPSHKPLRPPSFIFLSHLGLGAKLGGGKRVAVWRESDKGWKQRRGGGGGR